jgi:hypothetical protein
MPEEKMSESEYLAVQKKLLLVASLIEDLDLDGFLKSSGCYGAARVFDLSTTSLKTNEQIVAIARGALRFKNELPREEPDV